MVQDPTIPTLYLLPKIHKMSTNPPGRPMISGKCSLAKNIGKFIDFKLKTLVECLSSYIWDTTDGIDGIQLEEDMFLSLAMLSHYTLISNTWVDCAQPHIFLLGVEMNQNLGSSL